MSSISTMLAYVNRLSDLLWLFGRRLEHDAGVIGSARGSSSTAASSIVWVLTECEGDPSYELGTIAR